MKLFQLMRNGMLAIALSFFLIPAAQAGPIGDAFDATINQNNFQYNASASLMLEKGGELDAPFSAELSVREDGGKSAGVYGKSGAIWGELRNIDDLPRELWGLNTINMMLNYNGAHIESSKTSYAEVENLTFSSDHEKMNEVMGMMNQFTKFFTGKSIKVSQAELANKIGSLIGDSYYGPSEEELFLSALTGGNQSIPELIDALGNFIDAMATSGFMKVESSSDSRRGRTGGTGTIYTLTLGDSVNARGGEIFRDGLADFIAALMPGVGDFLADELARESGEVIANDLSDFLSEAQSVTFELTINVASGVIQSTDFIMDLSALDVPIRIEESVTFSYNSGYRANIPTNENDIIDMNQIIDGFVVLAEMGSSSFDTPQPYYFEDDVNFEVSEPFEVPFDSYVYSDVEYIISICGSDKSCRRSEMSFVLDDLRQSKKEGFLDGPDFTQAVRELRKGLK
jgi:hypothetical protein